jgi:hypothetical protein
MAKAELSTAWLGLKECSQTHHRKDQERLGDFCSQTFKEISLHSLADHLATPAETSVVIHDKEPTLQNLFRNKQELTAATTMNPGRGESSHIKLFKVSNFQQIYEMCKETKMITFANICKYKSH